MPLSCSLPNVSEVMLLMWPWLEVILWLPPCSLFKVESTLSTSEWTKEVWAVFSSTQHWSHCGGTQLVFGFPGTGTRNVLLVKLVGSQSRKQQPKAATHLGRAEQTLKQARQPSGMSHHLAVVTRSPPACPSLTAGKVTPAGGHQIQQLNAEDSC